MKITRVCATVLGLALTSSLPISAKLNLQSRAALRSQTTLQKEQLSKFGCSKKSSSISTGYIGAMIKLADGATTEELENKGVKVLAVRGNIAMAIVPIDKAETVSELKSVKKLEIAQNLSQKMDKVRAEIGVDKIHKGEDLNRAYTGAGVVTGIVDGGLDPNHVNFLDADGNSRFKYLTNYYIDQNSTYGYSFKEYGTPEKVAKFTTDDDSNFHGTHTTGIMAGSYRGTATVGYKTSAFKYGVAEMNNPYYGIAYDSDIVASCGDLQDMLVAYGVEGVLNYAYANNMPAVVNLSLGTNGGPHDGKSVMSQYLELAGKEAIICVAAGNEGDLPITLTKTMTADDKELKTFVLPLYSGFRYGQIYVYSEDETEFVIKVVVYNKARGTVTMEIPISTNMEGQAIYYASPEYAQEGDNTHANFTKAFDGYVGVGTMLDEDCGRYYALIDFQTMDNATTNAEGNYVLGFVVTGQEGKRIDCYCNGSYSVFDDYDQAGWLNGSTNSTVTDQACSNNVIAVGSYNIRDDWASLDGNLYGYPNSFPTGKISSFSSYGTLHDGRKLPHVCAPGCTVISSTNTYYVNNANNGITNEALQGKYTGESTTNYWHQCFGTSMACPVVTGSIALWLEADPGLTVDDVKEIIAKTSIVDADVTGFSGDPVQWGAGKFNAYEGLKEVLRKQGSVGSLTAKNDRLLVKTIGENQYNAFVAGADCLDIVVYNISGQPVIRKTAEGDETSINVDGLQRGYYIMQVNDRYSHRILVK